jgi:hypothetical protein
MPAVLPFPPLTPPPPKSRPQPKGKSRAYVSRSCTACSTTR